MIRSRPQPGVLWCTIVLLSVALLASLMGLSSSTGNDTSIITGLFYVFVGLFAVSFFFVLRKPRGRR